MGRGKKGKRKNLIDTIKSNPIKSNPKAEETDLEDESNGVSTAEETENAILSLSEAAAKIVPSDFAAYLAEEKENPEIALWGFYFYFERAFSQVSSHLLNVFEESPPSDVPLSHIPNSVYEVAGNWIKQLQTNTHCTFVMWALDRILTYWPANTQDTCSKAQVATFVALAMVLRSKPDALITVLPMLRERSKYQGEDKLPVIVWMIAQAFKGDLSACLYSWAHNLLPLVEGYSPHSRSVDLILRFVEIILSEPLAPRTILVNGAVREGHRLFPPSSFEILVRLTFPASSARVEATERFGAIYPFLKEVAFAPGSNTVKQIFIFSLKLAGEALVTGNPALAKEATAIAIRCMTENVDCFKQWDILYKKNIEASVALLTKLVDEWKDHSLKLLSSQFDTLTVNDAIYNFRIKNEKAITEGVANSFLYKDANKSCKLISRRLSRGSGGDLEIAPITAVFIAAAAAVAGAALALYSQ